MRKNHVQSRELHNFPETTLSTRITEIKLFVNNSWYIDIFFLTEKRKLLLNKLIFCFNNSCVGKIDRKVQYKCEKVGRQDSCQKNAYDRNSEYAKSVDDR